jgi:hypothetical protein
MPAALTLLCISWGAPGWLALGGVFLLSSAAMAALVDRGHESVRPADGAPAGAEPERAAR